MNWEGKDIGNITNQIVYNKDNIVIFSYGETLYRCITTPFSNFKEQIIIHGFRKKIGIGWLEKCKCRIGGKYFILNNYPFGEVEYDLDKKMQKELSEEIDMNLILRYLFCMATFVLKVREKNNKKRIVVYKETKIPAERKKGTPKFMHLVHDKETVLFRLKKNIERNKLYLYELIEKHDKDSAYIYNILTEGLDLIF